VILKDVCGLHDLQVEEVLQGSPRRSWPPQSQNASRPGG
jgi:hypothetical protein